MTIGVLPITDGSPTPWFAAIGTPGEIRTPGPLVRRLHYVCAQVLDKLRENTGDSVRHEAAETKTMPRATNTFAIMQEISYIDDDQGDLRRHCVLSLWMGLDENC